MLQSLKNCESELTHFLRRDPYPPIMSDRCAQLPNNKLPNKLAIELRNIHPKCVDRTQSFARAMEWAEELPTRTTSKQPTATTTPCKLFSLVHSNASLVFGHIIIRSSWGNKTCRNGTWHIIVIINDPFCRIGGVAANVECCWGLLVTVLAWVRAGWLLAASCLVPDRATSQMDWRGRSIFDK